MGSITGTFLPSDIIREGFFEEKRLKIKGEMYWGIDRWVCSSAVESAYKIPIGDSAWYIMRN